MRPHHGVTYICRQNSLDEPIVDSAGDQRGMGHGINKEEVPVVRWFHVAVRRRKTRRVSTGQTEELGKAGKEIGGGQREAVWFLNKNRGRSTMARREMWASSEHLFPEARAVRHSVFSSKSLKEQVWESTCS